MLIQDANATIKRQLQRLLLGVSVFLDVDDLEEIGDLELYIDQSVVINTFLSHGYFQSKNCLREVQATIVKQKPFMLTHEVDKSKGGGTVDEIKCELVDEQLRAAVFTQERRITVWYRIADFQLVSLKLLAEFTLLNTPQYVNCTALPIFIPGELLREQLGFSNRVTIVASMHNPGATELATELNKRYPAIGVSKSVHHRERHLNARESFKKLIRAAAAGAGAIASSSCDVHFLLYLNVDTFLGAAGVELAEELRVARDAKVPIVMCHENDPERGGCEFARFFGTTPQDLIDHGLYTTLAFAAYPGMEHRVASLALLAKAIGAKPQKLSGAAWARSSSLLKRSVGSTSFGSVGSRIGHVAFQKRRATTAQPPVANAISVLNV